MGDSRELRNYLKQNPQIKRWFKTNKKWFKSHPEVLRSMVADPSIIKSFNLVNTPSNVNVQSKKKGFLPKINFSTLSEMNEKLSVTNDFLNNISDFREKMKELPLQSKLQKPKKISEEKDNFND